MVQLNYLHCVDTTSAPRAANTDMFVSVLAEPERRDAGWVGGSILASLPSFVDNNFVTKAEYQELGVQAVSQKCC